MSIKPLLTVRDLREIFRLSSDKVAYNLVANGTIPASAVVRLGKRRLRFVAEEIERLASGQREAS